MNAEKVFMLSPPFQRVTSHGTKNTKAAVTVPRAMPRFARGGGVPGKTLLGLPRVLKRGSALGGTHDQTYADHGRRRAGHPSQNGERARRTPCAGHEQQRMGRFRSPGGADPAHGGGRDYAHF